MAASVVDDAAERLALIAPPAGALQREDLALRNIADPSSSSPATVTRSRRLTSSAVLKAELPPQVELDIVPGVDHSWWGHADELAAKIDVSSLLSRVWALRDGGYRGPTVALHRLWRRYSAPACPSVASAARPSALRRRSSPPSTAPAPATVDDQPLADGTEEQPPLVAAPPPRRRFRSILAASLPTLAGLALALVGLAALVIDQNDSGSSGFAQPAAPESEDPFLPVAEG